MEESILISTKKILGIDPSFTEFDLDIITHINTALATLNELGVGPGMGFMVEDETAKWGEFFSDDRLNGIKTYIYLRVRYLFDPPTSSYALTAMKEQFQELEWRLNCLVDRQVPTPYPPLGINPIQVDGTIDGGAVG